MQQTCLQQFLLQPVWCLQDVDQQPAVKPPTTLVADIADRDLAKLVVLTPSRKNGMDGRPSSHAQHVGSALTEGLRLFDEVLDLFLYLSTFVCSLAT